MVSIFHFIVLFPILLIHTIIGRIIWLLSFLFGKKARENTRMFVLLTGQVLEAPAKTGKFSSMIDEAKYVLTYDNDDNSTKVKK